MQTEPLTMDKNSPLLEIPPLLLDWYHRTRRVLPWRENPQPYYVWLSEIMLQQTRVEAVKPYFVRFLEALPTIEALANAPEELLLKLWEGLGYYSRVRNLQKAAQVVLSEYGGALPSDPALLEKLPGIGSYTAGAIASIAFGVPAPAVDGNVLRVVARITGDDGDIMKPDTKARMGAALKRVMPVDAPGDFNQALMELGATVCLPNGAPLCDQCPARDFCVARLTERTGELPVKAAKKARRVEERTVFLIFRDGAVALRRRKSRGLLAGLWEYPNELSPAPCPVEALSLEQGPSGKHIFTHIEWRMKAVLVQAAGDTLPEGWVWATLEEVDRDYAVPNAFQAFKPAVEGRLKGEGEEPWQSCISGME